MERILDKRKNPTDRRSRIKEVRPSSVDQHRRIWHLVLLNRLPGFTGPFPPPLLIRHICKCYFSSPSFGQLRYNSKKFVFCQQKIYEFFVSFIQLSHCIKTHRKRRNLRCFCINCVRVCNVTAHLVGANCVRPFGKMSGYERANAVRPYIVDSITATVQAVSKSRSKYCGTGLRCGGFSGSSAW